MKKDKREISIVRSSAAEYLTFIASTGADREIVLFIHNVLILCEL